MEVFVEGCVKCLIVLAIIAIVSKGEKNKKEKISQGKIYYGIFRMPILYSLAFMTSVFLFTFVSTILYYLFDITVFYDMPEKSVFIIEITISILLMYSYIELYKRHYFKLIKKYIDEKGKENDEDTNTENGNIKNDMLCNIKNIYKTNKKMCLLVSMIFFVIGGLLFTFVNLPQDYEKIKDSVVMIKVYDKDNEMFSIGSGFCVFDSNRIVTNYHVIEGAYRIEVITDDNVTKEVTGVDIVNKTKDMAILKGNFDLKPLKIGSTSGLKAGMEVSAIGSPEGEMNTVSTGIISNADNDYQIRITTPISPGSSGGVLLNDRNQVIGVTYATYNSEDAQNLNYAIKIDYFEDMYESIDSGENLLLTKVIETDKNYCPISMASFYRWTNKKEIFYNDILWYDSDWTNIFDSFSKEKQNEIVDLYFLMEDYESSNLDVKDWEKMDYIINLTNVSKDKYLIMLEDLSNSSNVFKTVGSYNLSVFDKACILLICGGYTPRDLNNADAERVWKEINSRDYSFDEKTIILEFLGYTVKNERVYW